jgi:hypothetical protein
MTLKITAHTAYPKIFKAPYAQLKKADLVISAGKLLLRKLKGYTLCSGHLN